VTTLDLYYFSLLYKMFTEKSMHFCGTSSHSKLQISQNPNRMLTLPDVVHPVRTVEKRLLASEFLFSLFTENVCHDFRCQIFILYILQMTVSVLLLTKINLVLPIHID
jgi:hypothetical protein